MKDQIKKIAAALGTQLVVSAAIMTVNATVLTVVSRKVGAFMDRNRTK